jgi:anti-sigma B factor antagonist
VHGIRIDHESDVVVLTAEGELDAYNAPALSESLGGADVGKLDLFVADFSKVSFLDSTALGLLVRIVKDVNERGGQARVVLPTTSARRIFEITTLDRVLPIAHSRADALRELQAAGDVPAGESS